MSSQRIAVISDTHGRLPDRLVEALAPADEIWHLGDVTRPEVITPLQYLNTSLYVVAGNCDPYGQWPMKLELERCGFTFRLQHLPPSGPVAGISAILYGHLHQPLQETRDGMQLLNPGAITSPRGGSPSSFAWIDFPDSGSWKWTVQTL